MSTDRNANPCHCGQALHPDHFGPVEAETLGFGSELEDMHAQHQTRCCACVDSFMFGASDCAECDAEGKASGEQSEWVEDPDGNVQ